MHTSLEQKFENFLLAPHMRPKGTTLSQKRLDVDVH